MLEDCCRSYGVYHNVEERNYNTNSESGQECFPTPVLSRSTTAVALLSSLSKVLERFVHEQLSSFLLESKTLPDDQLNSVFFRGRSAEWQLLSVVER